MCCQSRAFRQFTNLHEHPSRSTTQRKLGVRARSKSRGNRITVIRAPARCLRRGGASLCASFYDLTARQAAGALGTPHSPRPLQFSGTRYASARGARRLRALSRVTISLASLSDNDFSHQIIAPPS
jgi:hypothetical protein